MSNFKNKNDEDLFDYESEVGKPDETSKSKPFFKNSDDSKAATVGKPAEKNNSESAKKVRHG